MNSGRRKKIHERLGCFGYFGFGGGWEHARRVKRLRGAAGSSHYCNVCPVRAGCWQRHRQRCAALFPAAMELWNEILERNGDRSGPSFAEWRELTKGDTATPDLAVNGGNIEDGHRVAYGKAPLDRDRGTLLWPLERLEVLT